MKNYSSGLSSGTTWEEAGTYVEAGAAGGVVVAVGDVGLLNTAEMCDASSCSIEWAKSEILGKGPPEVIIIVVIGADSKGGLSSKMFPVLDHTPSKENINETS